MVKNLKVLELASVLAGPSVGQFFAELGAEVVKVENLLTQGDVTRSWKSADEQTDDRSAYFCSVNWGKKSVAVDLSSNEGKQVVHKLAAKADIIIVSYKPGDAEKLLTDYKTLSALNQGMIYAQVTGYGSDNPRVGYDAIIQAEAGFMFMNGEPDAASLKMPVALMDILAAHHLKEGILLALLEKTTSGKGKLVEVSLIQSAISSLANQGSNWLVANRIPQKQGSAHPNIAPYGDVFKTKDDKEILLAIGNDKQFQDLCKVLEIPSLTGDPFFITNQKRVEHREELKKLLQLRFEQFLIDPLLEKISAYKIPAGVIQNLQQVFQTPEAKALLLSSAGLRGVRTFVANDNVEPFKLLPPPHFGEHTLEILSTLNLKSSY